MRKTLIMATLVLALVTGACAPDATQSDEYQALENELAVVQHQLDETAAELEAASAGQDSTSAEQAGSSARHDAALVAVTLQKEILDDPESFGTEDEVVERLARAGGLF